MIKTIASFLVCLFILMSSHFSAFANSINDVNIDVISNKDQFLKQFDVTLKIQFSKTMLFNNEVFLAYHVYDSKNNEILWEGKRHSIVVNENGKSEISLKIDLQSELKLIDVTKTVIKFDLVDEKNNYWFSTNPEINLLTDEITYTKNTFKEMIEVVVGTVNKSPIIFYINVIFFIVFLLMFLKIKKSQLFIN